MQTAKNRLEIVVVAPSRDILHLEEEDFQDFLSFGESARLRVPCELNRVDYPNNSEKNIMDRLYL